ncbi:uncharacterized protein LOC131877786 [Tigriopus californicus]|uniref:uncharacterized protein LOC131877786 n=1 Tax=Tigriopus californicus TaxID=6832 RepID=UPI0027DA42C3|nr:uncharacterized protein LOC131877786 [Tigriopus californicus]
MDELCFDLTRVDGWYRQKEAYVRHGIRGAHKPLRMQCTYESLHPQNPKDFTISVSEEGYLISSQDSEHFLPKNKIGCKDKLCLVKCPQCPRDGACAHFYVCNCMCYSLSNICKHCHLISMSNIQPAPTIEDKDVVEVHECPNQDDLCHKVDNSGHRANDSGHRAADSSHRAANSGHRADDSGHRADDSGHRAHDFGHRGNSPGERCNKPGLKQDENGREENESPGDVTKEFEHQRLNAISIAHDVITFLKKDYLLREKNIVIQ